MSAGVPIVAAYVLGSVPFAWIASRIRGIDLRAHGSGNLGATNAIRVLGPGLGVPVLIADMAKGWAAVAWLPVLVRDAPGWLPLACGAAAVIGHVTSVFLRFRGGKGVATAGGAFLGLAPAAVGCAALVFAATLLAGRWVSLASLAAAVTLPAALLWLDAPRAVFWSGAAVALLVVVRHRTNVVRLLRGTESRVSFGKRGGAA